MVPNYLSTPPDSHVLVATPLVPNRNILIRMLAQYRGHWLNIYWQSVVFFRLIYIDDIPSILYQW